MSLQKIKPQYIDLTQSFAGNLTVQGNISSGNISVGNINVTSGIYSANYYFANGDPFTSSNYGNANVAANYGNANVAAYLPTYTGNINGGNLTVDANASITGNLVVGNISGRISPRVSSTASITSPLAWNSNSFDQYVATAQAGNLTINADAGTPVDGQKILFRFKDSGTARALTFTTGATNAFRAVGVTLPTTTTISKITYVGCIYNAADSRWDAIAVTTEA